MTTIEATAEQNLLLEKARVEQKLQPTDDQRNAMLLAAMAKPIPKHQSGTGDAASASLPSPIFAIDVHDLAKKKFKPRESLLGTWLHSQDLVMVYSMRGIGKTHFGLAVAYAIATGGKFLDWDAPQARKVLYLDGELPGTVMQNRLLMHLPKQEPEHGFLRIFTPDLMDMDDLMPDLATLEGQEIINSMIEPDTAVVIVDNLSAWARGSKAENDAESWLPIAAWALALRRRGITVVMIHHAGKGGDQRGTSKREDLLDVSIRLSRPKDYTPEQGARFELTFTKARHLHGDAAEALELMLKTDDEGAAIWEWQTLEGSTYQRVVELAKENLSQAEIARELEINRSTVNRHYRKGLALGAISK
jgi:DNA-binding CsgD family transcriptional regulator